MKYNGARSFFYPKGAGFMTNPSNIIFDGASVGLDWIKIYWRGALILAGIVSAFVLLRLEVKRRGLDKSAASELFLAAVPLAALFGRAFFVVYDSDRYFRPGLNFGTILLGLINLNDGGASVPGAVLGALIGVLLFSLRKKLRFLSALDISMPSAVLLRAVSVWGHFFDQSSYGAVVSRDFPHYFPLAVKIDVCTHLCCEDLPTNTGNIHYALFFYESCLFLAVFLILWFFVRKKGRHRGDVTLTAAILCLLGRGAIESCGQKAPLIGRIRLYQVIFFAAAAFFIALLLIRTAVERKKKTLIMPAGDMFFGRGDSREGSERPEREAAPDKEKPVTAEEDDDEEN